jgi:hypothetical protein
MRYSFPHYPNEREYIQPDPKGWKLVRAGMTFSEVVEILGEPIDDPFRPRPKQVANSYFSFGWLGLLYIPNPRTYSFLVYFNRESKVQFTLDPFEGTSSEDGIPLKPLILIPQEHQVFSHYPRILDVRWRPPAGNYPMKFEIELGHSVRGNFTDQVINNDLDSVYFCHSFGGATGGRVRVRAKNQQGTSDWSDFRNFEFTI